VSIVISAEKSFVEFSMLRTSPVEVSIFMLAELVLELANGVNETIDENVITNAKKDIINLFLEYFKFSINNLPPKN
jgi:hypothetical protein